MPKMRERTDGAGLRRERMLLIFTEKVQFRTLCDLFENCASEISQCSYESRSLLENPRALKKSYFFSNVPKGFTE
jgi:hypothetical protein